MYFALMAVLFFWMLGCGWAGYARRFGLFAVIALAGIGANSVWMVLGFDAHPLEPAALMAHAAAACYAISSLALGWLVGRITRSFRESRVR